MRMLQKLRGWWELIGFTLILLACAVALAQGEKPISPAADLGFTVYGALGAILVAFLGWLATHSAAFIRAHTKNAMVQGALLRMNESIFAAVKLVNQTLKAAIMAAKDPKSPGGTAITEGEADQMRKVVWDSLKSEYGGLAGIQQVLSVLGVGTASAAEDWVDRRIEAAVHDTNLAAGVSAGAPFRTT